MYLSPERREVFSSLRSLGLSKDPKDAQRQPYRFPDVVGVVLGHARIDASGAVVGDLSG